MPSHQGDRSRPPGKPGRRSSAPSCRRRSGLLYAAKLRGEKTVMAAYFGDGADLLGGICSSAALMAEAAFEAPVVFCCQNNAVVDLGPALQADRRNPQPLQEGRGLRDRVPLGRWQQRRRGLRRDRGGAGARPRRRWSVTARARHLPAGGSQRSLRRSDFRYRDPKEVAAWLAKRTDRARQARADRGRWPGARPRTAPFEKESVETIKPLASPPPRAFPAPPPETLFEDVYADPAMEPRRAA